MAEATNGRLRYRVVYSELVRRHTRQLVLRARELGVSGEVIAAIKKINDLLERYPKFGDPLQELVLESAQEWMVTVPPLVVKYIVNDARRLVMVVTPFAPLPDTGLN
ncbi:MAG: hypothetical protein FJ271_13000 [Planctomycetes bacterium]|nr:hypothetical protein [Planctomycetota bacterium]